MQLSNKLHEFIDGRAKAQGLAGMEAGEDLFKAGVLDSFSLVDLISMLESEYRIKIPDADVFPGNFRSIDAIKTYLQMHAA